MAVDPNDPTQQPPAQAPLNADLAGYPTVEALVSAYRSSGTEAKRLRDENEAIKAQRQLEQQAQYAANPRQDVPDRSKPGWYQRLETLGVPPEDLREAIRAEAHSLVQEELQPIYRMGNARTQVMGKYPDYGKFEADIGAWINSTPEIRDTYARVFSADPVAAFEWAYHGFGDNRRRSQPANDQGARAAEGAAHAAIPSQRSGDSRQQQFNADIGLEEAARAYRENPSRQTAEAYAKQRLRTVITDEHLFGGNQ